MKKKTPKPETPKKYYRTIDDPGSSHERRVPNNYIDPMTGEEVNTSFLYIDPVTGEDVHSTDWE